MKNINDVIVCDHVPPNATHGKNKKREKKEREKKKKKLRSSD
jgi:hypothetical protein